MVDLTQSTSFFSPLFGVSAFNMQCTPVNSVGYDKVVNGCENCVIYVCIIYIRYIYI